MKILVILILLVSKESACRFRPESNTMQTLEYGHSVPEASQIKEEIQQSTTLQAGKALQTVYKIESLLQQLKNEDLEELSFDQKAPVAFKLVEIHNLVDETMARVMTRRLNPPFQYPRAIYQ